MNWHAALLIGALAIGMGVVLYLPFFIWFRWRGAKGKRSPKTIHVTGLGVCWYGLCIFILFCGFAVASIAPQSWLGAQLRTVFGALGFAYSVMIAMSFVEPFLVKRGFVFAYRPGPVQDPGESTEVATKDVEAA